MSKWGVVASVVLMGLSGCTEGSPARDEQAASNDIDLGAPTGDQATKSTGGGTGTEGNRRPLVTFSADVAAGEGPLQVTFSIIAADDDKDPLNWSLDADSDGTTEAEGSVGDKAPRPVHTYRVKGTYTATATVSDGKDEVSATLTITVTRSEPLQTVEASLTGQAEGCFVPGAYAQAGTVPLGASGTLHGTSRVDVAVVPETIGRPFEAVWTFDTGYLSMYWFFTDGDGDILTSGADENPNFGNYVQSGEVPDAAAYVILFACGGPAEASVVYAS